MPALRPLPKHARRRRGAGAPARPSLPAGHRRAAGRLHPGRRGAGFPIVPRRRRVNLASQIEGLFSAQTPRKHKYLHQPAKRKRQGRSSRALPVRTVTPSGARVAPQRCPILRGGGSSVARNTWRIQACGPSRRRQWSTRVYRFAGPCGFGDAQDGSSVVGGFGARLRPPRTTGPRSRRAGRRGGTTANRYAASA